MSEQKVRVHSENDKDFERGSKIMISTYLRMFWINNRAEDRKTLLSPSIPSTTNRGHSRAKEHKNQSQTCQEPAFTHNSFIPQFYDVSMALCCMLTKQTHKCRYEETHHMKNPLSHFCAALSVNGKCLCVEPVARTRHTHTHKHKSLSHPQSTSLQSAGTVSV